MPHFEIRQILFGDSEVFTNLQFTHISTLPFELQPTNKIVLDSNGNVVDEDFEEDVPDGFDSGTTIHQIRKRKFIHDSPSQIMTQSQMATYRNHNGKSSRYDMISLFSL